MTKEELMEHITQSKSLLRMSTHKEITHHSGETGHSASSQLHNVESELLI